MKTKVRALAGAADEIGFPFGVIDASMQKGEVFCAEHGISSGAIVQFVKMCGHWNMARELILSFNIKDHVFGYYPLGKRGLFIALKSLISKKKGLWTFNKLEDTIRSVTSKTKFNSYSGCDVWVGLVDENNEYRNVLLNNLSYDEAIKAVIQSASVQGVIKPTEGKSDGGLKNSVGSEFLAKKYKNSDVVSVFSRTKEFEKGQPPIGFKWLLWLLENLLYTISEKNSSNTDLLTGKYNNHHKKIFMPKDVIDGMFSIKEGQNEEIYQMGLDVINLSFKELMDKYN